MKPTTVCCVFLKVLCLLSELFYSTAASGDGSIPGVELSLPVSHTALSGDLHVEIASSSFPPLLLQLSRLEGNAVQALTTFPVLPEARALKLNRTIIKIPCGYFSKGGQYYILLKKQSSNATSNDLTTVITRSLDVRWPMPQLSLTPEHVQTYPDQPVMAILEFPEVSCPPIIDSAPTAIPEFWLELHYCGHSLLTCDNKFNQSRAQVLYSDQVRGFPSRQVLTLRCELFGLAGHYALVLRSTAPSGSLSYTAAYVKAEWSDQFVFNVHARSIYPCETISGGIIVLFQYPSCILATGDRIRLFGRLRANVASLAPPTSLEYVAEQRVTRGQHSLHFDCDLFTERYVEYCFVYVSQAITGAVADVRMDCVPTLPVSEYETGGWGPWSPWTECSSTCSGGTKSRYRFCDSPPPRYGAKFCEGLAVETEKCGIGVDSGWECFYGSGSSSTDEIAAEIPEIQAEVGLYCRCGCVVHLGQAKPRRLVAASSQSCPGRTFWLIQADENYTIQFKVEQFHLPCGSQWLKVRDGRALSATLLGYFAGLQESPEPHINSSGSYLLLEFSSKEISSSGEICGGGFLAYAMQTKLDDTNLTGIAAARGIMVPSAALKLTAVHIAAIFFLSSLIVATALLAAQYLFRYRKYHIAQAEDQDSLADPSTSCASLALKMRASSNTTLLSEVISLTKLRPNIRIRSKHCRLRESLDCEGNEEQKVALAKEEDTDSMSSTATLTQQDTILTPATAASEGDEASNVTSPSDYRDRTLRRSSTSTTQSDKDQTMEKDMKTRNVTNLSRRFSNVSTATLTNGCYSIAANLASTARIRHTNVKESKDKKNREKLLAGPAGSEFSIACPDTDMELDYYDYNVVNAGAAPGSYLGMDPAFLVWIPPLDDSGEILAELNDNASYGDIKPKQYVDPGSNQESPEDEVLLPKVKAKSVCSTPKSSPLVSKKFKRIHPLTVVGSKINLNDSSESIKNDDVTKIVTTIQLHEFPKVKIDKDSMPRVHKCVEKEKLPVDSNKLDDIKFADDEDDDSNVIENQCNIDISYQDSNILSSR